MPADTAHSGEPALLQPADAFEVFDCGAAASARMPSHAPPGTGSELAPDPRLLELRGRLYPSQTCAALLQTLTRNTDWQRDYYAFGRRFDVPRLQAWYADEGVHYRYSDTMLEHHAWTATLMSVKRDIERATGHRFNAVLVTCYRDGRDHVTMHADDEAELGEAPVIASLSLGATRAFHYRHKRGHETGSLLLRDGELLVMQPRFQREWTHCVPVEAGVTTQRINLTFRKVHLPEERGVRPAG